ncbi:tetratricopeptide repeat protein [Streptomyces lydicus]|uniref:tetratricopeptide repeat protein n=1 Tax=Streptomyces lydicus TaxID=47763 RepID=UPI0010112D58|nr:tetratricopeptide repeat protein [Streptomyces lydicus]MDC7338570.1 tetratricopeptide repeat protein [Streptomyces lydicus]UEG91982.1 tetratricopeptide repeat protein [Streptomyces lydicus]
MGKRPGKLSRTPTSPLLVPRVVAWGSAAAVLVLAVAVLAWRAGGHTWSVALGRVLPRLFNGLAAFLSGSGISPGLRLAGLLLVVLALYAYWRATRSLLGYRPGPVQVQQLVDATAHRKPLPVDDLTSRLRMQLSESSLYPPTTVPTEAPPTGFLDLLGDVDLAKPGTTIPRLLSRLRPKLAYRVGGVLQLREHRTEPCGITVTLTAYVFSGARATTVWGRDWEHAVCRAAYWVEASLLPVTRAGRRPPWHAWWARELPPELLRSYQEAKALSAGQRYDQALERYRDALRFDPQNPYIRAEFAGAQEKLGLQVEALDTCQRSLALDGQTADAYNDRLWVRRRLALRRLRYLWRPLQFRETLGLRYRNAIILGTGERLTEAWYPNPAEEHDGRWEGLLLTLAERYWPAAVDFALAAAVRDRISACRYTKCGVEEITKKWLADRLRSTNASTYDRHMVRVVFQRAAAQELYRLVGDDLCVRLSLWEWWARIKRALRRIWPPAYVTETRPLRLFSRVALKLNRDVWAPLQLDQAMGDLPRIPHGPWGHPEPDRWRGRSYDRRGHRDWRTPADLATHIREIMPQRMSSYEWQDHYNSACVYAVAMKRYPPENRDDIDEHRYQKLADMAVEQLETAALRAESGFTRLERSWMLFEDPDLARLREEPCFADFVRSTYPSTEPPGGHSACPPVACLLEGYTRRLLRDAALVMELNWRERAGNGSTAVDTLKCWLRAEERAWDAFRAVVGGRPSDWADRATLIAAVQESDPAAARRSDFPPGMLQESDAQSDHTCTVNLLQSVAAELRKGMSTSAPTRSRAWCAILDDALASGVAKLPAPQVRALCSQYAAAWLRLGARLAAEQDETVEVKFRGAVHSIAEPRHDTRRSPEVLWI